ncbi:hypothetical protein FN3523_0682 [Francisella hispaniensis]|uniref:Uncharacterized protein n=1 Tax=Francisella hispaniensis TaxID=622488 RepID=F4BK45_9GAMM|nr:hypothetical protein FN3523_0682 [Francisella hispaniensis]
MFLTLLLVVSIVSIFMNLAISNHEDLNEARKSTKKYKILSIY